MTDRSRAGHRANGSTQAGIRLDGPKNPANDDVPPPAPTWKPHVQEPDPELLPDERPMPNPDENRDPPKQAGGKPFPGPTPTPAPDQQPVPPPGPNPTPQPTPI